MTASHSASNILGNYHNIDITYSDIKKDPTKLQYIDQLTEEICLEALSSFHEDVLAQAVIHIPLDYRTEDFWIKVIQNNFRVFPLIPKPSKTLCLSAIQHTPFGVISSVQKLYAIITEYKDTELLKAFIQKDYNAIRHIPPSPELLRLAIEINPSALQYIDPIYHTYELCYAAVEADPSTHRHIKDPTLKLTIPKKIPKTKTKSIEFDVSHLQHAHVGLHDDLINVQLNPKEILERIYASWWQNRFQGDDLWLQWIDAINDKNKKPIWHFYVAYDQAFSHESGLFSYPDFNLYHYLRYFYPAEYAYARRHRSFTTPSFLKLDWYIPQHALIKAIEQLNIDQINIFSLIKFLNTYESNITEKSVVMHILNHEDKSLVSVQAFLRCKYIEQLIINHFDLFEIKVKNSLKEPGFIERMRLMAHKIPNIDQYLQQLILANKNKTLWAELLDWFSIYPTAENQDFLRQLIKKEKDAFLKFLLISCLFQMHADSAEYLTPEYLDSQAQLYLSKQKKKEIGFLNLTQLPELKWQDGNTILPETVQAWLMMSLEKLQPSSRSLLLHYIAQLETDSQITLAHYIFEQLIQELKIKTRSLLSYQGLLIFTDILADEKITDVIEQISQLPWTNTALKINHQRIVLVQRLKIPFEEMKRNDVKKLARYYQQEKQLFEQAK